MPRNKTPSLDTEKPKVQVGVSGMTMTTSSYNPISTPWPEVPLEEAEIPEICCTKCGADLTVGARAWKTSAGNWNCLDTSGCHQRKEAQDKVISLCES
jgi:hypothetical protein